MRFILTDYQEVAAFETVKRLRQAAREFADDKDYSAVSLTAPTGAGKTVIAAAVIERLIFGDDVSGPNPKATVLWLTDNPSLNEQTKRKMLTASSSLKMNNLVTVDGSFDQETFDTGKVYFLNIQKLGKSTSYVLGNTDVRRYSLWDTIGQTIRTLAEDFIVVIDEAHRGTGRSEQSRPTIVNRIISDPDGQLPAAPIVWGISATPERFDEAMAKASSPQRTARRIKVEPEDVRASGLLKDTLDIRHPEDSQPSDATLTRLAAENIKEMTQRWKTYSESENEPLVQPVMVIQVRDGETEAGYREILTTLRETWPELTDRAIGHSLESHSTLEVDHWSIRYVAPENIQDDKELKVVLFKQALTTGWDCPRAETMLSFRRAEDYTYIAQLIGRMVRTPLARRIVTDDSLNVVSLFLPYYERESVDAVVEKLQSDPSAPPIDIVSNLVNYSRNPKVDARVFAAIEAIPSYVVPGRIHKSQIARLHAFASRLAGDGILEDAVTLADETLLALLREKRNELESSGKFQQLVRELGKIEISKVSVQLLAGERTNETEEAVTDVRDINAVFRRAKLGLSDGLAEIYWDALLDEALDRGDMLNPDIVKIEVAALASDPDIVTAVENTAAKLVADWFANHGKEISNLQASAQAAYQPIRAQAKSSEETSILLPGVVSLPGGQSPRTYDQHVFASSEGEVLFTFNEWEHEVVNAELGAGAVAWYRNPTGGEKSLRVPYFDTSGEKSMYPDFIFLEDVGGKIVPSIIDPHNYALADTAPKWRGLSDYASKHGDKFGRIHAVIKTPDGVLKRIDLKDLAVQEALQDAHTGDDIIAIFSAHGSAY